MPPLSKILIVSGIGLIGVGLIWALFTSLGGKSIPFGRLPGDIVIEKENFRFYFPLASSILLSIVLSAILYVIRYFSGK